MLSQVVVLYLSPVQFLPLSHLCTSSTATCTAGMFSHFLFYFFFANFLFCSPVTPLYPPFQWTWLSSPSRTYQALLLTVMTDMTGYDNAGMPLPHLILHPHMPCHCAPCGCVHHIALPLAAVHTVLPCSLH